MTDQKHPTTPPSELTEKWIKRYRSLTTVVTYELFLTTQSARWGYYQAIKELKAFLRGKIDESPVTELAQQIADQELDACCDVIARELICDGEHLTGDLRAIRRPKPLSLKEQALARTDAILNDPSRALLVEVRETLEMNRRALEQLHGD